VIYLDASALVTILVERHHAGALRAFLGEARDRTATSVVGMVETVRICDRHGTFPHLMERLVREHHEVTVSEPVRDAAASLPAPIKALDALHIASAEQFGAELTALVTYDSQMAKVARQRGLPVVMPGME
jgi:predicted nucleic acid-binding protein